MTEEVVSERLKILLMARLRDAISERGWTQTVAAERLGLTQPRVSAICRLRTSGFTLDALVNALSRLGVRVDSLVEHADWAYATAE